MEKQCQLCNADEKTLCCHREKRKNIGEMNKDSEIKLTYNDMNFDKTFKIEDVLKLNFSQMMSLQSTNSHTPKIIINNLNENVEKDNNDDTDFDDHFEAEDMILKVERTVDYNEFLPNEIQIQSIIGSYDYKIIDTTSNKATGNVKIRIKKKSTVPSHLVYGNPDKRNTVKKISLEEFKEKLETDVTLQKKTTKKKCKEYHCKKCKKIFLNFPELKTHMLVHQKMTRFKCPECHKCFHGTSDLNLHARVHTGERPFVCNFCEKGFSQKINLIRHIRIHTNERPYICDICDKKCIDQGILAKHMRIHEKTPYYCGTCKESFCSSEDFKNHTLHEHSQKNYLKCGTCSLFFPSIESRKKHTEEFHLEMFTCDICQKEYRNKSLITKHIMKHISCYKCKYCGKDFTSKTGLQQHIQRHLDYNPYVCEVCSLRCPSKTRLLRHMSTHTDIRPYLCEVCALAFKTAQARRIHHKHVHEQSTRNWKCEYRGCSLMYTSKNNMNRHMRIVHYKYLPHSCIECNKQFSNKNTLADHQKRHMPR